MPCTAHRKRRYIDSMPIPVKWKMPPIVKAYEAMGAIGDGRVNLIDERRARVTSSSGDKIYEVEISADGREISSNDNASYWQGYLGYPAIAVLIARGFYRAPANAIDALAGIPWKELNRKHRNDYSKTLAEVDRRLAANGHDPDAVRSEAEAMLSFIRALKPVRSARTRPAGEQAFPRARG